MADVVNTSGSSPQRSNVSYSPSPCSSSSALVSPNIVEAIDRIFPKSPSQLLQHSFSDSVSGSISGKKTLAAGILQSLPHTISTLPCTISMANMTTHTTTTATAVFTNLSTTSGTTSPVMSLVPTSHMDVPSISAQTMIHNISLKNGTIDLSSKKTATSGKRVSKADLEIMNNFSNHSSVKIDGWESNSSQRDLQCVEFSDSDDMCRPFVNIQKEKKKRKRKHLTSEEMKRFNMEESVSFCRESDSETPVSKLSKLATFQSSANNSKDNSVFQAEKKSCDVTVDITSYEIKNDSEETGGGANLSHDFSNSNIVTSSIKNFPQVKLWKKTHRQGLPKSKRKSYHIQKDSRLICKVFPPCYIVLKRIPVTGNFEFQGLTLQERVQFLSSLCAENKIKCASKWKAKMLTKIRNVTEDEFRLSHGRSLRRRQDICYVEPTEDDLMEDITSDYHHKVSERSHDLGEEAHEHGVKYQHVKGKVSKKRFRLQMESTNSNGHVLQEKGNKSSHDSEESHVSDISKSPPKGTRLAKSQSTSCLEDSAESIHVKDAKGNVLNKTSVGPSLVYVYPKTTVLTNVHANTCISINVTSAQSCTTMTKSSKSKNELTNTSDSTGSKSSNFLNTMTIAPVSSLGSHAGVKRSTLNPFPSRLSDATLAVSSTSAQNASTMTTSTSNSISSLSQKSSLPTNLCMVKIAGKDYLLSMPSNNIIRASTSSTSTKSSLSLNRSHISSLSVARSHPFIYQTNTGIRSPLFSQGNVGVTSAFTLPVQRSSVTMPDRITTSAAIHTIPSSLFQNSTRSLSSALLSEKSTVTTSPIVSAFNQSVLASTSSTQPIITVSKLSREVKSSSSRASLTTLCTTQEKQCPSSVTPFSTQATSIVVHQCPSLTSAGLSSSGQVGTQNASVPGARCFRIIVPACSVAGSSTRIATLGTSAFSSPLSRLTASSTLLPQRKQNAHSDMSPEQQAVKRQKLEKKYPLPPGVIIKTEPLENHSHSSSVVSSGSVRSLLSAQNIQLIAASSRSGVGGVQRFRIIAPSSTGFTVGSRPLRFGSNVIIRAPMITPYSSRSQQSSSLLTTTTVSSAVLPTLSMANKTFHDDNTSANVSSCNSAKTSSLMVSTSGSTSPPPISSSMTVSSCGTISLLSSANLLSTPVGNQSAPVLHGGKSSLPFASTTSNFVFTQPSSASTILSPSISKDISKTTENQKGIHILSCFSTLPAHGVKKTCSKIVEVEKLRQSVEHLVRLISEQEALGLKGQRLGKLKELLSQKEKSLSQLEKECEESQNNADSDSVFGSSVQEPVVID